jgi:hypothetical protein
MLAARFLRFGLAAIFVALNASSCQTRAEIPPSARRVTECVYHVLKSDSRATSVTVWTRPEGVQHTDSLGAVIVEYGFLNKDKKEQQGEIIVWGAHSGNAKVPAMSGGNLEEPMRSLRKIRSICWKAT